MYYEEQEIPKHKKKSHKTVSKAKHKHEYVDVIVKYPFNFTAPGKQPEIRMLGMVVERCAICGKVGNQHWFETEKCSDGLRVQLSSRFDAVQARHSDLDIYEIHEERIPAFLANECKINQEHKCED